MCVSLFTRGLGRERVVEMVGYRYFLVIWGRCVDCSGSFYGRLGLIARFVDSFFVLLFLVSVSSV